MANTDVGTEAAEAKRGKASDRFALNAEGKDVSDLTEAVRSRFVARAKPELHGNNEPLWEDEVDFGSLAVGPDCKYPVEVVRAWAIFGHQTHAGNQRNTAVNTKELGVDEAVAFLDDWRSNLMEGGWTNRAGEATAGAGLFIEAYARYRGVDTERVKAAWAGWDDATKEEIKADAEIKALVAQIRAERARQKADEAKGKAKPSQIANIQL